MRLFVRVLMILPLLIACEDALPVDNEITGLQVLGIRSEPVQLSPTQPLRLEALYGGADNETLSAVWFVCDTYVAPLDDLGINACPLLVAPYVVSARGGVAGLDIDVPSLANTEGNGAWLGGVSVLLLLCGGDPAPLPTAGETVDSRRVHELCDTEPQAVALKWLSGAGSDDLAVRNPVIATLSIDGEPLSADEMETEIPIPCEADCHKMLHFELVVDPADYDYPPDAEWPIRVNWYTDGGALDVYRMTSFAPEPLAATWTVDAPGRHHLYVVVRGRQEGLSFKKVVVELGL